MIVSSAWGGASYVLPVGAATIHPTGSRRAKAEYYRQRGRTLLDDRGRHGRV